MTTYVKQEDPILGHSFSPGWSATAWLKHKDYTLGHSFSPCWFATAWLKHEDYTWVHSFSSDLICYSHRISTARKEMAGCRLVFSLIESNWPLPYSTVPVPLLRDARMAGWVSCLSICASTMPRAQDKAAKGSIILWRRLTLPIWVYFIYGYIITKTGGFYLSP